tara:strand:- start:80 stop:565 length:486 start_codon:yes stop_codon:yes gene_type:complete
MTWFVVALIYTCINGEPIFKTYRVTYSSFDICRRSLYSTSVGMKTAIRREYPKASRINIDCYRWKDALKLQNEYKERIKMKDIYKFLNSIHGQKQKSFETVENKMYDGVLVVKKKIHYEYVDYIQKLMDKFKLTEEEAQKYKHDWAIERMKEIPFGTKGCL